MVNGNLTQYLTQGAIEGFAELVAPIKAFSYVVKPGVAALNDVVRVPFTNTSASANFSYSSGYATDSNNIEGKSITLNILKYQRIGFADSDLAQLNQEAIIRIGHAAGARLASDFVSASFVSCLTAGNFPNSGSYTSSDYTQSVALAALDKAANDYKWLDGERALICGTTLWQSLMNNSTITNAANFGNVGPVQQGKLNSVLGFVPYKTTITLPNSATGFAASPNGLLIGNAYHAPQESGNAYNEVQQITDTATGVTIGYRSYYDPLKATNVRVFDVLGGCGVGSANGVYWIK